MCANNSNYYHEMNDCFVCFKLQQIFSFHNYCIILLVLVSSIISSDIHSTYLIISTNTNNKTVPGNANFEWGQILES